MNKYSVVVPVHNEEGAVALLCARIKEAMDDIAPGRYEVIFVDDGSTDRTFYFLKEIVNKIKELVVVRLDKNYGQSLALQAGFDISQGEMIITLDGDLQNDPAYISRLLKKKEEGYDVVCGWLKFKHARLSRAMVSYIANIIQRIVFKVRIHDVGSMFRVYSRSALSGIYLDGCKHRFIIAMLSMKGAKIAEIEIRSGPRLRGTSKYGIIDRVFGSLFEFFNICVFLHRKSPKQKYKAVEIVRAN